MTADTLDNPASYRGVPVVETLRYSIEVLQQRNEDDSTENPLA